MNTSSKKNELSKAFALIAAHYADPYEYVDPQTGAVETRNSLGFWLDKVLGGVCYQLANGLDFTRTQTMPRARQSVERAIRAHKGDELSEVTLQRAVDWVQRLQEQEALAQADYETARHAYALATGKVYGYAQRATANETVPLTPAMAAAKRIGIGNVNVAAGYGSAQARREAEIDRMFQDRFGVDAQMQRIERLPDATGRVKDAAKAQTEKRIRTAAQKQRQADRQRQMRAEEKAARMANSNS